MWVDEIFLYGKKNGWDFPIDLLEKPQENSRVELLGFFVIQTKRGCPGLREYNHTFHLPSPT